MISGVGGPGQDSGRKSIKPEEPKPLKPAPGLAQKPVEKPGGPGADDFDAQLKELSALLGRFSFDIKSGGGLSNNNVEINPTENHFQDADIITAALNTHQDCDPRIASAFKALLDKHGEKLPRPTRAILSSDQFRLRDAIKLDDRTFYMGEVFTCPGSSREHAIAFTEIASPNGSLLVPRFFYFSNSDGRWRASDGRFDTKKSDDRVKKSYSKGKNIHYSQETRVDRLLETYFTKADRYQSQTEFLMDNINYLERLGIRTYEREIAASNETNDTDHRNLLDPINSYRFNSGNAFSSASELKESDITAMNTVLAKKHPGFMPDFTQPPKEVYTRHDPLFGNEAVEVSVYEATLANRPVVWEMACHESSKSLWIDSLYYADSKVSSYGTRSEVLNSGFMTHKPKEYPGHLEGLQTGTIKLKGIRYAQLEVFLGREGYRNITPILAKLLPVREFIEARYPHLASR